MKEEAKPSAVRKAVALRYTPDMEAPVVTAKGQGRIAEKIIQLAKANNVPLQEDPSLVEVLSKLDLDQQIPPDLYQLVAEILTFVYRTDRRARLSALPGNGGMRDEPKTAHGPIR
jgi:flagellar biosynthesis protein